MRVSIELESRVNVEWLVRKIRPPTLSPSKLDLSVIPGMNLTAICFEL